MTETGGNVNRFCTSFYQACCVSVSKRVEIRSQFPQAICQRITIDWNPVFIRADDVTFSSIVRHFGGNRQDDKCAIWNMFIRFLVRLA